MADKSLEDPSEDLNAMPRGTVLRVSALFTAALALALFLSWLLSGGGSELFRSKFPLRTYVGDAAGLRKGADVVLNGVPIGRVEAVALTATLDPNRIVEVRMAIQRRYMANIPVDSIAAITAANLISGDEFVNISLGKATEHVGEGAEIASLIQSGTFNPSDLVASLRDTMSSIDFVLTDIDQGQSPLAKIVKGDELYKSIDHQIGVLQQSIAGYADRKTPEGQFIYSDADYQRIGKAIADLDHSLEQVQSGQGTLGKFLNDPGQYDNAVAQIRKVHQSLADANAGKGAAGTWLVSDAKVRDLRDRIQSINKAVDQLTGGDKGFPKMLQSRELYDSWNQQAAKARDFEREFRENPRKFERIQVRGGKKKPKQL
jgi:phospholipid/cholesterol/gamma-HCH transport system substrate-binding protein